jgi:hypothetical protein
MATTTPTPTPYQTSVDPRTFLDTSTYTVPDTLITRTTSTVSQSTSSTFSLCSIYSDTWHSAVTSYYGEDLRPTICGGTPRPTTSSLYTSAVSRYNSINAQLDYENAVLDQEIRIKAIALAISGGCLVLALIFGIFLVVRRRRKQRELANAGIVNGYTLQTYPPPPGQVTDAGGHVIEPQKPARRWIFR